jgi:hypothetical protein
MFDPTTLEIADPLDMSIAVEMIDDRWPVVVIDDFYRHPEAVRRLALSLSFHHHNGNYPGSFASISLPLGPVLETLVTVCGDQLGHLLGPHRYYLDCLFGMIDGDPGKLNAMQRQPHFDNFCDAAAVIYLNPPEHCAGGTSFWRHRGTALVRVPDAIDDDWALEAVSTSRSATVEQLTRHCLDEALPEPGKGFPSVATEWWEPELTVPMRWNRLVAYDSRLFHTPDVPRVFGRHPASARLTQNLYFSS